MIELDLETALAEAVAEIKGEFGPRDGKVFPSDFGIVVNDGGCKRAFWHKLRNAPTNPPSIEGQLKMMTGDYLEEMVVDMLTLILPKHGYRVLKKQKFVPVPGTTGGKIDLLIEHLATGEREVIEVKSTGEKAMKFLPKPGHVLQTQSYMMGEGASRGWVVYVFREMNHAPQVFKVKRDDPKVLAKGAELANLAADAESGLDEPPKTEKTWQIQYCDLKECQCK